MDIMIRNQSSQDNTIVLFKVGLFISGDRKFLDKDNLCIREKMNANGQKIYFVSDLQNSNEESWKEAAEGLARMIENERV